MAGTNTAKAVKIRLPVRSASGATGPGWNTELRAGVTIAAVIVVFSLISVVWTPYDINGMDGQAFMTPGIPYLFGTDNLGRDVFSRVMAGGRYTLIVAGTTVIVSATIGSVLGMIAGYVGGIVSEIIMRIMDAVSSFPSVLLALVIVSVLDKGQLNIIIALIILFIPGFTRIMRSGMLQAKSRDYVLSARIMDAPHLRIIFVHIFPNTIPELLSAVTIGFSNAILMEAAMSYLGFGIQPPHPSWGRMLAESQSSLFIAIWCALAPGIMIIITAVAFNSIGEGIRKRI
ncbi:MAG: ABC transporter permease [Clostridiales Family XIII bacterium]|jgi:peptide/nickel transport system permease protein|nr:ABC transporter permease [Clostridiales Family XIII bacterium]